MAKYYRSQATATRLQNEGQQILRTIHTHDSNYGGHFIEVTSGTGKGKTAMLLSMALYNLEHFTREKVFFSECYNTPIQSLKLGKEKVCFFIPEKHKQTFNFRNRDKRLEEAPEGFFEVVYFKDKDYEDLYNKAKLGKINVPIFADRKEIMELIKYVNSIGEFSLILIDEMSEIATSLNSGMWHILQDWAFMCKDLRKCQNNVWYTAQNVAQIDWRIRSAVDIKIFGPGAKEDKHSRIVQGAIDNLVVDREQGSEFYISDGGVFGLFRLNDIFVPLEGLNYEINKKRKAN